MSNGNTLAAAQPQYNTLWSPDYTALDYGPLRDEVTDYVRTRYAPEGIQDDFLQSSAAMVCVDAVSYVGKLMGQREEDLVGEVWVDSVQLRKNLLKIVTLLGQRPVLPRAAQLTVQALAKTTPTAPITMPRLHTLSIAGLDGKKKPFQLMFEENDYYSLVTIPAGVRTQELTYYNGVAYQDYFQSTGATRQTFRISKSPVVEGSVRVSVHPKPPDLVSTDELVASRISEVQSLVTPLDQVVYKLDVTESNEVLVKFAIDRFGQVPPRGYWVYVDYRIGGGSETNVSVGSLNETAYMTDDLGGSVQIQFSNPSSRGIGGYPAESLEEIKERVPALVMSTDRFSHREDYPSLLKEEFPEEIDDVYALDYQTDRRMGGGVARRVPQNAVYLWILPSSGDVMSDDQKQVIASTLEGKNLIAVEHYLFDPDYLDWTFRATVHYPRSADPSDLEERIRRALLAEYGVVDYDGEKTGKLRFVRVIRRSRLIALVQDQVGSSGYVDLAEPASDIDPFAVDPPAFGQVARLDSGSVVLDMVLMEGDE